MFSRLSLGSKLAIAFVIIGVAPFVLVGTISLLKSSSSLSRQSFNQLEAVREIKKAEVERLFKARKADMNVLVEITGALRHEAFNKLTAVRNIKGAAVTRYLKQINDQIITFSNDRMIVDAMREFKTYFRSYRNDRGLEEKDIAQMRSELRPYYTDQFAVEYKKQNNGQSPPIEDQFSPLDADSIALQHAYIAANPNQLGSKEELDAADDGSPYSRLHKKVHPIIRDYLRRFGYYDIFLVDPETGDIVYSVFKELDYSTSLLEGPYSGTNFAEAFRRALKSGEADFVAMTDYKRYTPSYEAPAGFVASPIFDGDEMIGVALFQFPIELVNEIMTERAGLGKTGETYLVGPDQLMRSDSYLDPEHHSVAASFQDPALGRVNTEAADKALAGETGAAVIIDYNGNPVLSAYMPVQFGDLTWALLAEVDVAEAMVPVDAEGRQLYQQYIERYGYYDLFLFTRMGTAFTL